MVVRMAVGMCMAVIVVVVVTHRESLNELLKTCEGLFKDG
jgi:hypothetical protein